MVSDLFSVVRDQLFKAKEVARKSYLQTVIAIADGALKADDIPFAASEHNVTIEQLEADAKHVSERQWRQQRLAELRKDYAECKAASEKLSAVVAKRNEAVRKAQDKYADEISELSSVARRLSQVRSEAQREREWLSTNCRDPELSDDPFAGRREELKEELERLGTMDRGFGGDHEAIAKRRDEIEKELVQLEIRSAKVERSSESRVESLY